MAGFDVVPAGSRFTYLYDPGTVISSSTNVDTRGGCAEGTRRSNGTVNLYHLGAGEREQNLTDKTLRRAECVGDADERREEVMMCSH